MSTRSAHPRVRSMRLLLAVVAVGAVLTNAPVGRSLSGAEDGSRPNVLVIVTDDQTASTFSRDLMPNVFSQLADKGVLFERGYVNTSMCCPSRAQILTGLYGQHTGVDHNEDPLTRPTIPQALHDHGYATYMVGKYLNSWPCPQTRPEFTQWVCAPDPVPYQNPTFQVNGTPTPRVGYTTDLEADYMSQFIRDTPQGTPFFGLWAPYSPHLPANDDRCAGLPVDPYRPPSFDEDTVPSKPRYLWRGPLTEDEIALVDQEHRAMTQAVTCLDPAVGTVLASLGDREQDTLVVYLSDNGFLYGEHRLWAKLVPYEESVRVPFIVRYPPLVPEDQPRVSEALVENVDIAPTIAELAGFPWGADGRSLLPLLADPETPWRDGLLIEHCEAVGYPCTGIPSFFGVVTADSKYVEYVTGEQELYDLANDPYELVNHEGDQAWAALQAALAAQLEALRAPPLTETTIVTGPSAITPTATPTFTYFSQSRFATYQCRLDRNGVEGGWFACDGQSVTLGPLDPGDYTFLVAGTDEFGTADPTPAFRSFTLPADLAVDVNALQFKPKAGTDPAGGLVAWNVVAGRESHTVVDTTGLGLFASPVIPPGGTFSQRFISAGSYPYACTIHPSQTGVVNVPMTAPPTGTVGVKLPVSWAVAPPPDGLVYDVQARVGNRAWASWVSGRTIQSATYTPRLAGSLQFRARLRSLGSGATSGFSPVALVTIDPAPPPS